jgi:hypothetical protein
MQYTVSYRLKFEIVEMLLLQNYSTIFSIDWSIKDSKQKSIDTVVLVDTSVWSDATTLPLFLVWRSKLLFLECDVRV